MQFVYSLRVIFLCLIGRLVYVEGAFNNPAGFSPSQSFDFSDNPVWTMGSIQQIELVVPSGDWNMSFVHHDVPSGQNSLIYYLTDSIVSPPSQAGNVSFPWYVTINGTRDVGDPSAGPVYYFIVSPTDSSQGFRSRYINITNPVPSSQDPSSQASSNQTSSNSTAADTSPESSSAPSGSNRQLAIGLGVGLGVGLPVAAAVVGFFAWRIQSMKKSSHAFEVQGGGSSVPTMFIRHEKPAAGIPAEVSSERNLAELPNRA